MNFEFQRGLDSLFKKRVTRKVKDLFERSQRKMGAVTAHG